MATYIPIAFTKFPTMGIGQPNHLHLHTEFLLQVPEWGGKNHDTG
jgi:hypothetical protein